MDYGYLTKNKHTCPICGRVFYATTEWVYRVMNQHTEITFCRYNCMRAYQNETKDQHKARLAERRRANKLRLLTDEEKQEIIRLKREGLSHRETARRIGRSEHAVETVWINYKKSIAGVPLDE